MEFLNEWVQNTEIPLLIAFLLGLLTAISPCPLATNITATAYIAKSITQKRNVVLGGFIYTLGRVFSYTTLGTIIFFGLNTFSMARIFQSNGEKWIGFILVFVGLVMLEVIPLNFFQKISFASSVTETWKDKGLLGSFVLGILFALAFCPYSGALFFGMLIPLMLSSSEGLFIPIVFSVGTGIPVLFFALVIAYSMGSLGKYFNAVQKMEKIMRIVAGSTFVITGVYYLNIYWNLI